MPNKAADDLVVVQDLSFKYPAGEQPAIQDINLRVKRGEFLLIAGPTGAGKTTLVLTLIGLIPNVLTGDLKGTVTSFGFDTRTTPVSSLASKIGIVFDQPEAQFVMGVVKYDVVYGMENLLFTPEEMRKRFAEIVKLVRLEGLEERPTHQLSGGQMQRVAVGSGLVLRPELLILDEPTGQLDPVGRTEVFNTLRKLKQEGFTIILVTHDVEDLIDIVDRVVILNEGRIAQMGTPQEVFRDIDQLVQLGIKVPQTIEIVRALGLSAPKMLLSDTELFELIMSERGKTSGNLVRPDTQKTIRERRCVVETKDLSFRYEYPPVSALNGINLSVYEGEFIGIVGQNGSGKTTLVKHFNGLLRPTSGSIVVDALDTKKMSVADLSRVVGYVFQFPNHQIFSDSVWEEVCFGLRNAGLPENEIKKRAEETLRILGIENLRNMNPFFLSRGVQGKVAFAAVIAMQPKIVVVDEPTTGQDWKSSLEIMNMCKKLNETGRTIIVISHDMRLIAEYVDRAVVMSEGRIISDGSPSDLFVNDTVLQKAFIQPPPIARVFRMLKDKLDLPFNVSRINEMVHLFAGKGV